MPGGIGSQGFYTSIPSSAAANVDVIAQGTFTTTSATEVELASHDVGAGTFGVEGYILVVIDTIAPNATNNLKVRITENSNNFDTAVLANNSGTGARMLNCWIGRYPSVDTGAVSGGYTVDQSGTETTFGGSAGGGTFNSDWQSLAFTISLRGSIAAAATLEGTYKILKVTTL